MSDKKDTLKKTSATSVADAVVRLPNGKPVSPIQMLKEVEAYLTFRLMADEPFVPAEDMQQMKNDLAECLRRNRKEKHEFRKPGNRVSS